MADVLFKKGLLANLPAAKAAGTFYVTTDERALYLDVDDSTRIRIGDFQEFANLKALQGNTNPSTSALYYIADLNVLAKYNGSEYVQINLDTGATSIEVTGEGNVISGASYDPATRKITLTRSNLDLEGSVTAAIEKLDYTDAVQANQYVSAVNQVDGVIKVTRVPLPDYTEVYDAKGAAAQAETNAKAYADGLAANYDAAGTAQGLINDLDVKDAAVAGQYVSQVSQVDGKIAVVREALPASDVYSIVKEENNLDYAAVYHLTKNGENTGTAINIPKDMVVSSGKVVTNPTGQPAGTYIELTLANSTADKLYINVGDLIEYVTGGATAEITVSVDETTHVATATINDGSIAKGKLTTEVQASLAKADSAVQSVAEGSTNGTVAVDGTDVAVHGLGSAAYADAATFETAGAADKALTDAKAYADSLKLTWGSF